MINGLLVDWWPFPQHGMISLTFDYVGQTTAYSNFIKTWKKCDKSKTKEQPKSKSAKSKKHKSKIEGTKKGEKRKVKKGKK